MRHWTERAIARSLKAFAEDIGIQDFHLNPKSSGPDAYGRKGSQLVWFEIKAAKARVNDASQVSGSRPGRFRIDPNQHAGRYGTPNLWYALVVYEGNGRKDKRDIVQIRYVRSDKLPQRDTVISLTAIKD